MGDGLSRAAVNVQPGERFAEDAAVRERALRARAGAQVFHSPLQTDDLPQPLDVAPRKR